MEEFMHMLQGFEFRNEFWCLLLPLALMAIDIITGFLNAWAKQTVQSSKLRTGLSKKIGELAVLVIGELFSFALKLPPAVMKFIALYIILMELISIIENLAKVGVNTPKVITKALEDVNTTLNDPDAVKEALKSDFKKEESNDDANSKTDKRKSNKVDGNDSK